MACKVGSLDDILDYFYYAGSSWSEDDDSSRRLHLCEVGVQRLPISDLSWTVSLLRSGQIQCCLYVYTPNIAVRQSADLHVV